MKTKKTFGKRVLSLLLTLLMVVSLVPMSAIPAYAADGLAELNAEKPDHNYVNGFCTVCDGFEPANYNAEKDCYEIANAGQLYWFADKVNNDNENFGSVDAVLTTNIVVNEGVLDENGDLVEGDYREWTPIGNDDVYYFGTFDGQNYTVSGLYFNDNQTNFVGLFGHVYENGIVKNTGVATSYFCGKERVGGVVALGYRCTIVNCYNSGTISGDWYVGGVVAHCQSITITDCYNTGIVIGGSYIGGVVGVGYDVEITNCHNTNKVSGEVCVGGVSAYWQYGTITNCYNTGEVRVSSDGLIAGGVAGENFESTIVNCYNTGNVNGGEYYAGGVVGICNKQNGKIINCYSTGMITCNDDTVGGTVGYCPTNDAIRNCYYLAESENDEIDGTTFKTEAQFKSGEVAVLLQGDNAKIIWGQTIGTDNFPKLGGDAVYIVRDCQGNSAGYGNTMGEIVHSWNNGVCTGCTKACEHSWDNGVCTICTKSCEHNWEDGVCTICETVCEHDWYYGTCDICSKECAHEELEARFEWGEPYDSEFECFVSLIIDCKECGYTVAYESGYGAKTESAEAEDCMHPGYDIYEIIFEVDGAYYSDTKEFTVKSDKHTDLDDNGFCSACGGFEPAKFNEEEWIYEISNAGQLYWYAKELNENNTEMSVVLTKDIVIPENAPNWEPIEASYVTFDGQFHTVSGLKSVHEDYTYVGMFGNEVWWYEIKNLHLTNSYFEGPEYVGGIVASMNNGGTVENCYVTNTTVKGGNDTGTLVGFLGGSNIVNCYVDNDTLVGYHNDYGSIENSYYVASEENENGGKTLEQFKSGEVAYLLQAGVVGEEIYDEELDEWVEAAPEHIWGQTIGEDSYPTLGGAKVYEIENCKGETLYSNTNENAGHNIENGFCTVCDGFEPANYNAEKDCYEIANAGQLYWFAEFVNAGNTSANAVLTADIVVNENVLNVDGTLNESGKFREWTPIGNEFLVYSGTFDGQNHTVSGLYVNNPEQHGVGLVGCVDSNGIVKNTGVVDLYFLAYGEIGGVVGICRGNVTNCYNTGTVVGDRNIGGVVGYTERGNITNCFNLGAVSGNYHTGGVVGYNEVYVTNCYCLSELDNGEYDGTTYKTLDEFKSGEVAYLLGEAFGQTIGEDDYPVLGGAKVYQVTDSDGNVTYTNTNESAVDELAGYSISLGDKIAVNYHMSLTDETLADENAKMVFTVPDTGSTYTVEIPVKDAVKNGDYYVFTYEVAAKEMTSEISAKLVTSESELVLEDYTVQQYAEYIIEQSKPSQGGEIKSIGRESLGRDSLDGEIMDGGLQDDEDILPEVNDYEKAVPLVKAMLNYGAYAQIHFGYNTSNLANANLSEDEKVVRDVDFSIFDYYVYGSEEGVSFYGGALSLKSETAIKLYFVVDGEIPEVTVDGEPYELKKNGTLYELKIADIPAHRLGDFFEVKVGGLTVEYSTFSYAYAVTDTDNEALKDVMNAMYNYCIESHKYSQISK